MVCQTMREINIRRLLTRCEAMASDAQHKGCKVDWRLSKYLKHLDEEIESLQTDKKSVMVSDDSMREYQQKIDFLKGIVKADQLENPLERTVLCQHLLPSTVINTSQNEYGEYSTTKELHLQVKGKHQKDLRSELFGDDDMQSIRKRKGVNVEDASTKDNIDDIIKHHHDMQEKVAEEMIKMAQSMKHNSLIARDIINSDNLELDRSTKVADSNYKKLKTESDRLDELNKRKCSWTIWIMLAIVCLVFINMIIFIKFFRKRKR